MEFRTIAERICGNIVLAENAGEAMRKWRTLFEISQSELARRLKVSASVISDYESSRRSPGINFLKRFVLTLLKIDEERGSPTLSRYRHMLETDTKAVLDIVEYTRAVTIREFCKAIDGEVLNEFEKLVHGHTFVDSLSAILSFNAFDFYRLYGLTSERALIFTKVTSGRSPMVAVRVSNLKPAAVVLHGSPSEKVDEIARKIADVERIPLIVSNMDVEMMISNLRGSFA